MLLIWRIQNHSTSRVTKSISRLSNKFFRCDWGL